MGYCSSINKYVDINKADAPCKTCRLVVEAVFITKTRLKIFLEIVVGEPIPILREFLSLPPFAHFNGIVPAAIKTADDSGIRFVDEQGHHYDLEKEIMKDGIRLDVAPVFSRVAYSKSRRPRDKVDLSRKVSDWVMIDLGLRQPAERKKKRRTKACAPATPPIHVKDNTASSESQKAKAAPIKPLPKPVPVKKKEPKKSPKSLFDY